MEIAKDENNNDIIIPAPDSDILNHNVTVRICKNDNIKKLLNEGLLI